MMSVEVPDLTRAAPWVPRPNVASAPPVRRLPDASRCALILVLAAAALALVASSDELHNWLLGYLPRAEAIIRTRPLLGVTVFVAFSALSALIAFVSSAVIVPVGVYVWGKTVSILLLWVGWTLGGICAYALSRHLGRRVVNALGAEPWLGRYEHLISARAPFHLVLLFQLAVPSEVPGYLFGLVRYTFWKYLVALALAAMPYAVATT